MRALPRNLTKRELKAHNIKSLEYLLGLKNLTKRELKVSKKAGEYVSAYV